MSAGTEGRSDGGVVLWSLAEVLTDGAGVGKGPV